MSSNLAHTVNAVGYGLKALESIRPPLPPENAYLSTRWTPDDNSCCCGLFGGRAVRTNPDWTISVFITTLFFGVVGGVTGTVFLGLGKGDVSNYLIVGISILVVGLSSLAIWRIKKFKPLKTQEDLLQEESHQLDLQREVHLRRTAIIEDQGIQLEEQKRMHHQRELLIQQQSNTLAGLERLAKDFRDTDLDSSIQVERFSKQIHSLSSVLTQTYGFLDDQNDKLYKTEEKIKNVTQKAEGLSKALQELTQQTIKSIRGEAKDLTSSNKELSLQLQLIAEKSKDLGYLDMAQEKLQSVLSQMKHQVACLSAHYEKVKNEKETLVKHIGNVQQMQEKIFITAQEINDRSMEFKDNNENLKKLANSFDPAANPPIANP